MDAAELDREVRTRPETAREDLNDRWAQWAAWRLVKLIRDVGITMREIDALVSFICLMRTDPIVPPPEIQEIADENAAWKRVTEDKRDRYAELCKDKEEVCEIIDMLITPPSRFDSSCCGIKLPPSPKPPS